MPDGFVEGFRRVEVALRVVVVLVVESVAGVHGFNVIRVREFARPGENGVRSLLMHVEPYQNVFESAHRRTSLTCQTGVPQTRN